MIKALFNRVDLQDENHYKIQPGVFLKISPDEFAEPIMLASKINGIMETIAAQLCQFLYTDDNYNKRPTLIGCSAGTLKPKSGSIYLRGARKNIRNITDTLKGSLPEAVSALVEDIKAVTIEDPGYSIEGAAQVELFIGNSIELNPEHRDYILKRINVINVEPPHKALSAMLNVDTPFDAISALTLIYLSGADINKPVSAILSELEPKLSLGDEPLKSKQSMANLERILSGCKSSEKLFDALRKRVIENLSHSWLRKDKTYDIAWDGEIIGTFGKMVFSPQIYMTSTNKIWVSSTVTSADERLIPSVLDSVTPCFPPAIKSLLPNRVDPILEKLSEEALSEVLIKTKPHSMGGIYFRNAYRNDGSLIKTSRIKHSLKDICSTYIFTPESSNIDLDQSPEAFVKFNEEIANKAGNISIPGYQIKAPAALSVINGKTNLSFATPEDFTHIIKFPSAEPKRKGMVYAELLGMLAAAAGGVEVPPFKAMKTSEALVASLLPKKSIVQDVIATGEPAYLIELFDRPVDEEGALFMNEDFLSSTKYSHQYNIDDPSDVAQALPSIYPSGCQAITVESDDRYHTTEILCKVLRERSSQPEEDLIKLFKQMIVNTVVGNGDAHLKNFSLLHKSVKGKMINTRLSPAYDIVSTRCLSMYHYFAPPVCMLGSSYTPSRNDIISDGIKHFGFDPQEASALLDGVLDKLRYFSTATLNTPMLKSVFSNSTLGIEIADRFRMHMNLQIGALADSAPNHDIGLNNRKLFELCYPGESYDVQSVNEPECMSDKLAMEMVFETIEMPIEKVDEEAEDASRVIQRGNPAIEGFTL